MFKSLSIAQRIWLPTLGLAAMLFIAGGFTTVRTQKLIASAAEQQGQQQDKLELAVRLRGQAADGEPLEAAVAPLLAPDNPFGRIWLIRHDGRSIGYAAVCFGYSIEFAGRDALDAKLPQAAGGDAAARGELLAALDTLVALQSRQSREMREAASEARMRTVWGVLGLMAFIVAASALGAYSLTRTVRRPMRDLVALAERIGQGDLTARVDRTRPDAIGDVLR